MNDVTLNGCRPEPLASYLKALAVLRLVSEQADPQAKGYWKNGEFHLQSTLDSYSLVDFFANNYSPTPIVSPWNGGSGFYEGDSVIGRDAIMNSKDLRLAPYRDTIAEILSWPEMPRADITVGALIKALEAEISAKNGKSAEEMQDLVKNLSTAAMHAGKATGNPNPLNLKISEIELPGDKKLDRSLSEYKRIARKARTQLVKIARDEKKPQIIRACRNRLGPKSIEWVDAAIVIGHDGKKICPPLLVSGGNDGRLDYSNKVMELVSEMLLSADPETSRELLLNALFDEPTSHLVASPAGQHDPGRAGGFNQGSGNSAIMQKEFPVNPWDYLFSMEGSIAWAGSVSRRQGTRTTKSGRYASSPFTVRQSPVGYSSASSQDPTNSNGEIWTPVWENPTGYPELRAFLSEGRAEIGRRPAGNGIEFAEAVASLGVDRGVSEFVRYALLKRRGTNLVAVPLSHFPVVERREADLIRQLDPILTRVDRFLRDFPGNAPPAQLASARRNIDEAIYDVLLSGGKTRMRALVACLGRLERLLSIRDLNKPPALPRPLSGLAIDWIPACDDGSVEVRLAASLASISGTRAVGPLRANLSPVDPRMPWKWAQNSRGQRNWEGNSLSWRLMSALGQRTMDHQRGESVAPPFYGAIRLNPGDIAAYIDGDVDETLLEDLLFGFTLLDWKRPDPTAALHAINSRWARPVNERPIPWSWAQLKMLFLPSGPVGPDGNSVRMPPEPSVLPLLRAGRIEEACNVAQRRLFAAGLSPLRAAFPDSTDGARLGASLLFPVQTTSELTKRALSSVDKGKER
jgi:CRISPR-associated protein Csx17